MPTESAKSVIQQMATGSDSRAPSVPTASSCAPAQYAAARERSAAQNGGALPADDDRLGASQLEAGVRAAAAVSDAIAARVKQVLASFDFPEARPARLTHEAVVGLFPGNAAYGLSGTLPREKSHCAGAPFRAGLEGAASPSRMTAAEVASAVREQAEVLTVALAARHAHDAAVVRAHLRECAEVEAAAASPDAATSVHVGTAAASPDVVGGCGLKASVDRASEGGVQSFDAGEDATAPECAASVAREVQAAACEEGGLEGVVEAVTEPMGNETLAPPASVLFLCAAPAAGARLVEVSTAEDSTAEALRELDEAAVTEGAEATLRELDAVALAAEATEIAAVTSERAATAAAAAVYRNHEDRRLAAFRVSDAAVGAAISSLSRYAVLASAYARAASVAAHTLEYVPNPPPPHVQVEGVEPARMGSLRSPLQEETGGAVCAGIAEVDVDAEVGRGGASCWPDGIITEADTSSSAPPLDEAERTLVTFQETASSFCAVPAGAQLEAGSDAADTQVGLRLLVGVERGDAAEEAATLTGVDAGSDANESSELVDLLNEGLFLGAGIAAQQNAAPSCSHVQTNTWGAAQFTSLADAADVVETLAYAISERSLPANKSDRVSRDNELKVSVNPGGSPACK